MLAPPEKVEPRLLVRDASDDVGRVFLALAMAYNDVKGIVGWLYWLDERKPDLNVVNEISGEYRGIAVQGKRYAAGILNELMELIRSNIAVLRLPAVATLVASLHKDARAAWDALVDVACGTGTEVGELRTALARIRHNVAFHYYNAKELTGGFLDHFSKATTNPSEAYKHAWWSPGETLARSRFHYADAAAEGATARGAKQSVTLWDGRLGPLSERVSIGLRFLIEAFIRARQASGGASP